MSVYARAQGAAGDIVTNGRGRRHHIDVDMMDFDKKILHSAWHPTDSVAAIAAQSNLYIYESDSPR